MTASNTEIKQQLLLDQRTTIDQKIALINARSKKHLTRTIRKINRILKTY